MITHCPVVKHRHAPWVVCRNRWCRTGRGNAKLTCQIHTSNMKRGLPYWFGSSGSEGVRRTALMTSEWGHHSCDVISYCNLGHQSIWNNGFASKSITPSHLNRNNFHAWFSKNNDNQHALGDILKMVQEFRHTKFIFKCKKSDVKLNSFNTIFWPGHEYVNCIKAGVEFYRYKLLMAMVLIDSINNLAQGGLKMLWSSRRITPLQAIHYVWPLVVHM